MSRIDVGTVATTMWALLRTLLHLFSWNDSATAKEEIFVFGRKRHDQHVPQRLFEQAFGFSPIRDLLFLCALSAPAGFPKAIGDGIDDFLIVGAVHALIRPTQPM
jgi:hypothetical protein